MRIWGGYVYIVLAACFWGFLGIIGRFAMERGVVEPMEVAFWRALFAGVFFAVHCLATRQFSVQSKKDLAAFAAFGVFSIAGFFAAYQFAVLHGGAALSSVLLYTAPAWVAVFVRFIFGIRISFVKAVAIGISLGGVACISLSATGGDTADNVSLLGIVFGLVSGLLYSTHYIFTKIYLGRYSAHTLYGICMVFGAAALFPFVSFAEKNAVEWTAMAALGLICTYGAYLVYCAALKRLEPTQAAVLATLEPVIAIFAAWWVWHESFALSGWIGAALVVGAVLLLVVAEREPQENNSSGS